MYNENEHKDPTLGAGHSQEIVRRPRDRILVSRASFEHPSPFLLSFSTCHGVDVNTISFTWLGHGKMSSVVLRIDLDTQSVSRRPPVASLIFIVSVHGGGIKDERFASAHVCCRILIPPMSNQVN
jgi:hypothetical protein